MPTQSTKKWRTLGIPCATLILLFLIVAFGGIHQGVPEGAQRYFDHVVERIDAIPYRIGGWVGIDLGFTEVEVKMLRPNKMLQRTYQDPLSGQRASLSIVHCTDVRDMIGHYPPNCYPAHGWDLDSIQTIDVQISGQTQQARAYSFSRSSSGNREAMQVVSFFIAPGGDQIFSEMAPLEHAAKRPGYAGLGAAQVQIVTPMAQSRKTTTEMMNQLLVVIQPVIDAIEEGVP